MFWADDGLDTGPILLQRECDVEPNDTVNTIYKRFLFPEGVKGTVSVVKVHMLCYTGVMKENTCTGYLFTLVTFKAAFAL